MWWCFDGADNLCLPLFHVFNIVALETEREWNDQRNAHISADKEQVLHEEAPLRHYLNFSYPLYAATLPNVTDVVAFSINDCLDVCNRI